jgi:lipopolysaccharide transport system permease protein
MKNLSPRRISVCLVEPLRSMWRNRSLIILSARHEIVGRYRGSILGLFWTFFYPLLMLLIYSFVFGEVFSSRWPGGSASKAEFAIILFSGLIFFNLFSDCISRAPGLVLQNANLVKRVVFPLEILPFTVLVAGLFHLILSFFAWFLAYFIIFGAPNATVFLMPVVLIPLCLFITGSIWLISSLGVYLRDISQFIGLLITLMMFLSPIFYPLSAIPSEYRLIFSINPLTPSIEMLRGVLIWGTLPNLLELAAYWLFSIFFFYLGFFWFQWTREGFADVL